MVEASQNVGQGASQMVGRVLPKWWAGKQGAPKMEGRSFPPPVILPDLFFTHKPYNKTHCKIYVLKLLDFGIWDFGNLASRNIDYRNFLKCI